jgi:hypothetical protein
MQGRAAWLALALLASAGATHARTYPWCLVYQEMTGTVVCAFESFAQCQTSTGGNTGFCTQNPAYVAPAAPPSPRRAPLKKSRPRDEAARSAR